MEKEKHMKNTKKSNEPVKHRRATCLTPSGYISHGMIATGDIELDFAQRDALLLAKPNKRHERLTEIK